MLLEELCFVCISTVCSELKSNIVLGVKVLIVLVNQWDKYTINIIFEGGNMGTIEN